MTYFQATDSERQEAIMLHRRFPESLKGPILRSVQFSEFVACMLWSTEKLNEAEELRSR